MYKHEWWLIFLSLSLIISQFIIILILTTENWLNANFLCCKFVRRKKYTYGYDVHICTYIMSMTYILKSSKWNYQSYWILILNNY